MLHGGGILFSVVFVFFIVVVIVVVVIYVGQSKVFAYVRSTKAAYEQGCCGRGIHGDKIRNKVEQRKFCSILQPLEVNSPWHMS